MNELVTVRCYKERGGCGTTFRVRRKDGILNRAQLMCPNCMDYGRDPRRPDKITGLHVIDIVKQEEAKK